ncbi:hypothetical protein TBLA_0B00470 [Henningerozyma blattae CBS 6284]|uniref:PSP1 C-terminal domain-containing protein n=1 Tax=Henningerozyma blattae (strain ATCC 34711 / CBS 6284 / DSM 70876 / NBRC 10599 / NRRL Y-10934 / UCD 77-7) TaxID=1071380 RepID=I2GXN9_HENB6|nr:hypothetical protein TBLA_0B00470 [Tetrapisispora blattae CBS 6284]CCH58891.1 hypothetical protein TBLA_0B00470 [Tetrapisispora blattae CBS 6284]
MSDLPSINSTTSISDNVALKNYYENLLFRNASGKSLSGEQRDHDRGGERPDKLDNSNNNNNLKFDRNDRTHDFVKNHPDFITGWDNPVVTANANAIAQTLPSGITPGIPSGITSGISSGLPSSGLPSGISSVSSGISSGLTLNFPDRRSSYISDSLIASHSTSHNTSPFYPYYTPVNNNSNNNPLQNSLLQNTSTQNSLTGPSLQNTSSSLYPPTTASAAAPNTATNNATPNTGSTASAASSIASTNTPTPVSAPPTRSRRNTQPYLSKNQQYLTTKTNPLTSLPLDNGLILLNNNYIITSNDLLSLYKNYSLQYFSMDLVTDYIDSLKLSISTNANFHVKLNKFIQYLIECNSNNQDYKPLALVTLKNGKLELLSTPKDTKLIMKRYDLIIIDGDRGKDLAMVVEPTLDFKLAILLNFLKKKIHFDSLITNKLDHIQNTLFINYIFEQKELKFYDLKELTQLIIPSKQVLRFATPWEVTNNLKNKYNDELKALQFAKLKLSNNSNLNIQLLNSEFQFDHKKLTFYYLCNERNDFRDLIKELFKFYKTRIWLCAIPNNLNIQVSFMENMQNFQIGVYKQLTTDLFDY